MRLADLGRFGRSRVGDDEAMLRLFLQFIDDFNEVGAEVQADLLRDAPESVGDVRWDAFLAAIAEHLAYHNGLPIPGWVDREGNSLIRSWFLSDLPSVIASALAESPAAFRRRGIFITQDFFARA